MRRRQIGQTAVVAAVQPPGRSTAKRARRGRIRRPGANLDPARIHHRLIHGEPQGQQGFTPSTQHPTNPHGLTEEKVEPGGKRQHQM